MASLGRRYLVHIRLGEGKPAINRIKQAADGVKHILEELAIGTGNCKLAYTSHDGAVFGFFLKTNRYAPAILGQLQSPGSIGDFDHRNPKPRIPPPLLGEDSILIVEVGEDFCGYGFSKAWTWLQHH